MGVYRGGEGQVKVAAPNQLQDLIQKLEDAVAAAESSQAAAATSASNAETFAAAAGVSETAAELAQTNAETAETAAELAEANAEAAYNSLNNLYLGTFASDPTTDNDSSALDGGELYYNTTDNLLYVYDSGSSTWGPTTGQGDFMSTGSVPMTGTLDMAGNHLLDYTESDSSPTSSSGAITLDLEVGNIFNITLTENITTVTISNVPASGAVNVVLVLTQDATGSRTITWPSSVKWASGAEPTLTTTASAVDIISMFSVDAGTTWYAFAGGMDMS